MNIKRNKFIFISNYNLWKLFNFGQYFVIYVLIKLYPFCNENVGSMFARTQDDHNGKTVSNETRKNKNLILKN